MTIWETVHDALAALNVPLAANTMIMASDNELPDLFLVYLMVSNPPELHADDAEIMRSYRVQVSTYSRSGLTGLPDVESAMLEAGFARAGARELPYSRATRHFGLAQDFVFMECET
jgi:hypothetical protein